MDNKKQLVISHLELRRIVGVLGISLPVIVAGGGWLVFSVGLQESVSAYYYTPMRDVLVGLVFFMTGFFWTYRGYGPQDRVAGILAAFCGWMFSIFPTSKSLSEIDLIGSLHLFFAVGFFTTLIYFSGFLFTKTDPDKPPTPQKLRRNIVYRFCAVVMALSLGVGLVLYFLPAFESYRPLFWGEAIAIEAFGISWLVKGEGILKDEEKGR